VTVGGSSEAGESPGVGERVVRRLSFGRQGTQEDEAADS